MLRRMSKRQTAVQRFSVNRAFAVIVGLVGGMMFVPPSVVWALDALQHPQVADRAFTLLIVTAIGWLGLALTVRFIVRPRLVLLPGVLVENRFFFSKRMRLEEVTSIDRTQGKWGRGRFDDLTLSRAHPHRAWAIDLGLVDRPESAVSALRNRCPVKATNR